MTTYLKIIWLPALLALSLTACGPKPTPPSPTDAPAEKPPAAQNLPTDTPRPTPPQSPVATPARQESVGVSPVKGGIGKNVAPRDDVTPPPESISAESISVVNTAKTDLAQRLNISAEAISVTGLEDVTWQNGALGCPQPGMMYTQALIPGYKITLQANGAVFNYHGAAGQKPFLCEGGTQ